MTLSGSWFSINCNSSGLHTATVSGGALSYGLDPDVNFTVGELCTVTVFAANVVDQDGVPNNMTADYSWSFTPIDICALAYTPIYDIQGSGAAVALTGTQTTQGVVVGDYEGPCPALRGFYLEDPTGDGDPATSDGIFVFDGSNVNTVNPGDVVRVTGHGRRVPGPVTDHCRRSAKCGTGPLPTDVTFPVASPDFLNNTRACWSDYLKPCTSPSTSNWAVLVRSCCPMVEN